MGELLEEVEYLRKAVEAQERKISDLTAKSERRTPLLGEGLDGHAASSAADLEALAQAHTTIAKAFGDVMSEHACSRLVDDPILKFTALLFRQPLLRRTFYLLTCFMWLFALFHAAGGE